uniref:NAD-dependent epimerase/dehydratase family protein n=1 Tax=Thaumasiovibrio occultus TaxID=1891184 RepID=UPI000B3571E3|nr:NAD-dependent epimerase/dehydratase family protein [Thaumasiovibrio occultus]
MQSRILLTGATGFIGRQLVQQFPVARCVVRPNEESPCEDSFEIEGLTANTVWDGAFEGIDAVVHLAGLAHSSTFTKDDYQTVNVDGTLRLANEAALAGIKRFVFVSSIGVNGQGTTDSPFSVASEPHPHNDYAQSKYDAEQKLAELSASTGMEVVVVRPTLVYGPKAPGNFGLLTRLVKRLPMLPFGIANNRRHFISVHNLCDLLVTCANAAQAAGHVFLASESAAISTREFTDAIAKGLDKNVWQVPIPISLMRLGASMIGKPALAEQLFGNLEVDSSNLSSVLEWTPPYTLEQSMQFLKVTHQ